MYVLFGEYSNNLHWANMIYPEMVAFWDYYSFAYELRRTGILSHYNLY